MRRPAALSLVAILALGMPWPALGQVEGGALKGPLERAALVHEYARLDRVIAADESGIARPAAIAWDSLLQRLVLLDAAHPGTTSLAPLIGNALVGTGIDGAADRVQLAYDAASDRLLAVDQAGTELRLTTLNGSGAAAGVTSRLGLRSRGLVHVDGIAIAGAALWVLDGRSAAIYRVPIVNGIFEPGQATKITLASIASNFTGLAVDARTGHLFVLASATRTLWELDASGSPIATRDLTTAGLHDPRGMVLAPSGDPTDPSAQLSLYIADAGAAMGTQATGAGVYEVSLTQPLLSPLLAAATVDSATVVQTINTWQWSPASPDPDGFDYIPSMDRLLVSDSEVEETTGAGWHNVNVWFATRQGGVPDSDHHMNTLLANPTNNEPSAAAYDEVRNEFYSGKDGSSSKVWVYGAGTDGIFGTSDDQQLRYFTTYDHGVADGEGLGFGNGNLYVADGLGKEIWTIKPGNDGVVGTADDVYSHFDVLSLGQNNPEGIDFDNSTGNLWVVSNDSKSGALEVTTSGVPVSTLPRNQIPALAPGGLAIAPSSVDNSTPNVWIADRGVDNNQVPSENDGKIWELSITPGGPPPPPGQLVNGDFESANGASPTAWTVDPRFTQSSALVHGGTFAGRHQAADNSGYTILQDVSVSGGQAFTFSGWVDVPATSDAFKIVLKVQWRTASGSLGSVTVGKVRTSTTGWVQLTTAMTSPAGATIARVQMVVSSLNATIYVDDFTLTSP